MSPKRKTIRNFSASQIQAFSDCPRYWLQKWILNKRLPDNPAQIRGKAVHAVLEEYFKTGKLDETHPLGYHRYIKWLKPILPDPNKEKVKPEFRLFLDTPSGKVIGGYNEAEGIPLVGIIDALFQRDLLNIGDLKTTTDLRNAKTPAELYEDTQLNTYGKWAFGVDETLQTIRAEHWYVLVSSGVDKDGNPKPAVKHPRSNKILCVGVDLTRDSVNRIWERDCETMEKMKVAAKVESFEDLTPNVNFCDKYNGCDYKENCGIAPQQSLFAKLDTLTTIKTKKGKIDMAGFMDKVNKARKKQGKEAASTEPKKQEDKGEPETESKVKAAAAKVNYAAAKAKSEAVQEKRVAKEKAKATEQSESDSNKVTKAPSWKDRLKKSKKAQEDVETEKSAEKADSEPSEANPESLTPPDGADRKTSSAEEEGLRAKAAKALEKKEAVKVKKEEKERLKAEGKEPPKTTRKTKSKRGFTLYVGCMPAKGEHKNFELIEDWTAELISRLNETVKEATGHADYRLTGFNEKDVVLGGAISSKIEEDGLPAAIVVSGYHPATDLLIPHATDVVRAIGK